jgi:hypothetical protein
MTMYTRFLAIDVEVIPDESACPFLKPLEPPALDKRYTDPAKVEADRVAKAAAHEQALADQRARMSLDPFAGRIVCVGYQTERDPAPTCDLAMTEDEERTLLTGLGVLIQPDTYQTSRRTVVGYNIQWFDWPFVLTRARLLGVKLPPVDLRRFGNRDVCDVYAALTCDGQIASGVVARSLTTMARRFGIPVEDDVDGSQVAALWAAGRYADVSAHCRSDVSLTVALARRLRLIPQAEGVAEEVEVF